MMSSRRTKARRTRCRARGPAARLVRPDEGAGLAAPERARQALQHHRVQADAGLSHRLRAVRGLPARLFRLEHAAADHRADHAHGRRRDHRPLRAIQPGRHPAAGLRHRRARAPAGIEPLSRHHVHRRRACRQCRPARRGRARAHRLDRNGLSPPRRSRRHRASRAGARVRAAERFPPAGRPRSRGARAALRHHPRRRTMVDRAGHRPGPRRRLLRRAPRAAPRRRHDRDVAHHHGRRSVRPPADRRLRRRARPARGQPQRHAGADRGADAGLQGGLRQHRPRSQDAADAAAQSRRGGAALGQERSRLPRGAGSRRSRNPTN